VAFNGAEVRDADQVDGRSVRGTGWGGLGGDEFADGVWWGGAVEEVALAHSAAEVFQGGVLVVRFDSFGDDVEVQ
jgi:hypothetical protein